MIKIAVVTWPGTGGNMGTILQGMALVQKLRKLGYDARFFTSYKRNGNLLKYFVKKVLCMLGVKKFVDVRQRLLKDFRKKYSYEFIPNTLIERRHFINNIDVFITGSDQIWNTYFKYNPFYFLDFVKQKKKIAYSSSIGTVDVNPLYKDRVRKHLLEFSHIGVREKEAVDALALLTNRNDIVHVLDPVFLLNKSEWGIFANKAPIKHNDIPEHYILCYIVGVNEYYHEQINDVKNEYGINSVIIVPAKNKPNFMHENAIIIENAHPFDFLYLIEHATIVCSDSFHATAFCINFSKEFILLKRFVDKDIASQNSRLTGLLARFGLEYKQYCKDTRRWKQPIDYTKVVPILEKDRSDSIDFLVNAVIR